MVTEKLPNVKFQKYQQRQTTKNTDTEKVWK